MPEIVIMGAGLPGLSDVYFLEAGCKIFVKGNNAGVLCISEFDKNYKSSTKIIKEYSGKENIYNFRIWVMGLLIYGKCDLGW